MNRRPHSMTLAGILIFAGLVIHGLLARALPGGPTRDLLTFSGTLKDGRGTPLDPTRMHRLDFTLTSKGGA